MVPWHPPCALISLIFSSLRPETNCFLLCGHSLALVPASRNWPFRSNLLAVQLSRCKVLHALALRSGFEFPQTLKTIQSLTLQATVSSYAAHAVSSVSALALPRFSLPSSSLHGPALSFLLASDRIDLGFSSGLSAFACSLERR